MAKTKKSTLALRLRLLRVASGMRQEEVADLLGIGRSAYTYYELSRSKPDYDALIRLSRLYRVSIDYLVGATNFPDTPTAERTRVADDLAEETAFGMLSLEERRLLCLYRQMPEDSKADLMQELEKKSAHS
ncbi:MAG: helix-turn-helix domain-containing protein [Clostridia bacterium]|nr:helix-turn-helix domain-containing protein [Clostridia bacterium]